MKIIFPKNIGDYNNSPISVIHSTGVIQDFIMLADKDVPAGKPYKIVNDSEIPSDRTYRSAWRYNFNSPDGYGLTSQEFNSKYPNSGLAVAE